MSSKQFAKVYQRLRHILFRIKATILYKTKVGKKLTRLGWKAASELDGISIVYESNGEVLSSHTLNNISDERIAAKFLIENKTWTQQSDTIIKAQGSIFIEPQYGLAFFKGFKLIYETKSRAHTYLFPKLRKAYFQVNLKKKFTEYDQVIHFDGYASKNLYHFFDDGLNGLLLIIHQKPTYREIPVIVTQRVYDSHYFQFFLKLNPFTNLNWVIQKENEWFKVKTLIKGVASHRLWQTTYNLLDNTIEKRPYRKVFLNRTEKFQRRLINNFVIENLLIKSGFEVVYAEQLTYTDQIKLFSETKYLVALHGAGITNTIFSDVRQLHLLEILSDSLTHPHYYWFLELLHIHYYDGIMATPFDINWNYSIDESHFRTQLEKMLSHE